MACQQAQQAAGGKLPKGGPEMPGGGKGIKGWGGGAAAQLAAGGAISFHFSLIFDA